MLHNIIVALQETSSRNGKEAILLRLLPSLSSCDIEYLHNVYSPYRQSNVKKYKVGLVGEGKLLTPALNSIFGALSTREVTGNAALELIAGASKGTTIVSHRLLRYLLDKDIRAGVGISTLNKILKKLKMEQVAVFNCMLASPYNEKHLSFPCYVEPKLDGVRCLAHVESTAEGTTVTLHSRNGNEFVNFGSIVKDLIKAFNGIDADIFLDGEVTDGDFDNTMTSVGRKTEAQFKGIYTVFDIVTAADMDAGGTDWPIEQRRAVLHSTLSECARVTIIQQQTARSIQDIASITSVYLSEGYEGSVCKPVGCGYVTKRSKDWVKVKPFFEVDMEIVATVEGSGRNKGKLGAVICKAEGIGCKVGSGWSDELRHLLWDNEDDYIGRTIEVQYQEKTKDGSLRFPTFKRFRDVAEALGEKV